MSRSQEYDFVGYVLYVTEQSLHNVFITNYLDIILCLRFYQTYAALHRTEIVGSGLCAKYPHHFPFRLFYLHFDTYFPCQLTYQIQFLPAKNCLPHHFRSKSIPPGKHPHQKSEKLRSNSPTTDDPHHSPSKSLLSSHQTNEFAPRRAS